MSSPIHEDVQDKVMAALQGDLRQLGWFRALSAEARVQVARLIALPDGAAVDQTEEALSVLAIMATSYEVMLDEQGRRLMAMEAARFARLKLPHHSRL